MGEFNPTPKELEVTIAALEMYRDFMHDCEHERPDWQGHEETANNLLSSLEANYCVEPYNPDEAARHSNMDHTGTTDIIISALTKEH